MGVDRDQMRRDAQIWVTPDGAAFPDSRGQLGHHCLTLLTELEQAEEDSKLKRQLLAAELDRAESRLAKVPALVEAAKILVDLNLAPDVENLALIPSDPTPLELMSQYDGAMARLRDALAAYEADQ